MDVLVPLPVALPLVAAAALTAFGHFLGRRLDDLIAIAATAAMLAISLLLVFRTGKHALVYWFGGWHPRQGTTLGISFTVDRSSAAIAALAAALALAALVFSWRYFDEAGKLFAVLMLVFAGGMSGFALSGDLFNMFVWFELMSVAAYALTAYGIERPAPIQGAINFAVTNTVGGFCILFGVALVYARTGALNLDQIGAALAHHRADGLVIAAFALITAGFLTKAGAVPFHFWLADAYAVAPVAVCVLLSGVMSDLGLQAVTRIYWPAFSGSIAAADLRPILVAFGLTTALVGGWMCFLQRDLKRLLAFATISNIGTILAGAGLLTQRGVAAASVYVNTNGLLRGALFLAVGMLIRGLGSGDELRLRGRGSTNVFAGIVFVVAALAIGLLPPFGPFLANALTVDGADAIGYGWVPPLLTVATILSAGTILRAAGRIFLGLGDVHDPLLMHEPEAAEDEPRDSKPVRAPLMWIPTFALLVCGVGLAFVPNVAGHALADAAQLVHRGERAREVLRGVKPPARAVPTYAPSAAAYAWAAAATLGAIALAAAGLYRRRLPALVRRPLAAPARTLHALHSGVVGDYVAWLVVGLSVLGGLFALALR